MPIRQSMACLTDAYIDGLMQERCNSIANALELRLSCTNPSICVTQPQCVKYLPVSPGECVCDNGITGPTCDIEGDSLQPTIISLEGEVCCSMREGCDSFLLNVANVIDSASFVCHFNATAVSYRLITIYSSCFSENKKVCFYFPWFCNTYI